jgi:DNA-nicking Smr family endonuclease
MSEDPGAEPEADGEAAVALPLTGELDLHAFAPRDVASVVEEYVRACREQGVLELRRLLTTLPGIVACGDAPPERGGWGATLVRLAPLS